KQGWCGEFLKPGYSCVCAHHVDPRRSLDTSTQMNWFIYFKWSRVKKIGLFSKGCFRF
uniref:Uncharacterized protein n=1 Tax=Aegilops tauschii subsp. strangulata TaxID=200361 RepID=A0A453QBD0_AEGTS